MQYLDGKTTVTHIIASNLTPKKAEEFRRYRIVKPAWVVDSIKAGKVLPWNDYRVIDEGEKQRVLAFDNGKVSSRANVRSKGYRDQSDASWYTSQLRSSQAEPVTSAPNSTLRSRLSKQRLPTPDDDIEDLPPSHQPEFAPPVVNDPNATEVAGRGGEDLVTPPKTSPPLGPEPDPGMGLNADSAQELADDSLYADPTPPELPILPPSTQRKKPSPEDRDSMEEGISAKKSNLTAEEHNAILLRDPKVRKSTVIDPNFLEQYYRESRLHHLSTWKADLKSQLQAMASEQSSSQKARQKRPPGARRYILHVDFDSFFAAVSLKKHPQWIDKPAVVAHGNGSGSEIASCNYPARKYGVKNGMWMKRAQELCPDLKILPYDFPAYEEASRAFYDAILRTGGIVQSVSIDEVLIDVSNLCIAIGGSDGRKVSEGSIYREQAKADEIATSLREQVKQKTGCNVSVGIGGNILLAKVALRRAKPAGQYQIKPAEVLNFIGELQVQDLPGVAWSTGGKLEEIGIKLVKDIRECSKEKLIRALGPKTGEKLYEYSRGIDRTEVGEQVVRKSVSAEVNWGVRFENQEQADEFIASLCNELQKRLIKEKVKGKQFTMKIMRRSPDAPLDPPKHLGHGKCDTYNKSLALGVATNSKDVLTKEALGILRGFGFSPGELRGIGVQMTKLEPMKSATDGNAESSQRRLQFKIGNTEPAPVRKAPPPPAVEADPIQDDPETPRKPKAAAADSEHVFFGAQELNHSTPSRRPLNTLGTQFLLPTQVDPKVLAELPSDIRSKLLRQARQTPPTPTTPTKSRLRNTSPSKPPPFALTALPAHSQLDPDILAALPLDVRAEVLAQYAAGATPSSPSRSPSRRLRHADQTLLPQSPRKNRLIGIPANRPIVLPVKRGRGRPPRSAQLAAAAVASAVSRTGKTLTQANFISLKNPAREDVIAAAGQGGVGSKKDGELDEEFLAALPEEIRKEVVEEHKRARLEAARLAVTRKQKADAAAHAASHPPKRPQTLKVARPTRPKFTKEGLWREKDLRGAVREWVHEFKGEGPYEEDAGALGKYLGRVVAEERDLGKAVGVLKWLDWVVGELEFEDEDEDEEQEKEHGGRRKWDAALEVVREDVREAARERGLGSVVVD
jgi:DNA repair protein REV1